MLALPYLFIFHSAKIILSNYEEVSQVIQKMPCFVFAISADSFNYYSTLTEVRAAAIKSESPFDFYILHIDNLNQSQLHFLHAKTFPALIPFYVGKASEGFYGPFSYGTIYQFINFHSTSKIGLIKTSDELEHFFLTTATGILISIDLSKETPNEKMYPPITEFYYEHFNEIDVSFIEKSVLDECFDQHKEKFKHITQKSGFYLYRFFDNDLHPLPDLSNATMAALMGILNEAAAPTIHLFSAPIANHFERENTTYGIAMINLKNDLYISSDKADVLLTAGSECQAPITYLSASENAIPEIRYGFPRQKNESFYLVKGTGEPYTKYGFSSEVLTIESIEDFCKKYQKRELDQFYKIGTIPTKDKVTKLAEYDSKNVLNFTKSNEFVVLGICYVSDDSLLNFTKGIDVITKEASNSKILEKVSFGCFSIGYNDWPGPATSFQFMPRILLFEKGKLIGNERGESVDSVIKFIMNGINHIHNEDL